ncbi:hypothetical protein ACVWWW_001838 [Lysobacter sp. HA18]
MSKALFNCLLVLALGWLVLLDSCLTRRFSIPLHWLTATGFATQAMVAVGAFLMTNTRPSLVERFARVRATRLQLLGGVVPIFLALLSPAMISHGVNFALYGQDKIVVGEHMRADLSFCCVNPFKSPPVPSR